MITANRLHRLVGLSVRCAVAAGAVAFCASVYADPSKDGSVTPGQHTSKKMVRKVCYTYISGSAMPQPCDRLGTIPTTAIPMTIIGNYPVEKPH